MLLQVHDELVFEAPPGRSSTRCGAREARDGARGGAFGSAGRRHGGRENWLETKG